MNDPKGQASEPFAKIKWAPRLQPHLVQRLYEADAKRMPDVELCDDVGIRLYLRCQSILQVRDGKVECPECSAVFDVSAPTYDGPVHCPNKECGWQTTFAQYKKSWSKRRIFPGKAIPAFQTYYDSYPKARTYVEKILLIDALIHSFHWDLQVNKPNRSVANNLIEGNHDDVVAFLNALSGGDVNIKSKWMQTTEYMMRRRKRKC